MRLQDRVSIITGAGSGIGRATAGLFANEGAKVIVADIDNEGGSETMRLIKAGGGEAAFVQVDVASSAQVERMVNFTVEKYGEVNILFNCAGITLVSKDYLVTELDEDVWDRIIGVNLKGIFLCCKFGIPELIKCGGGSVINVASVVGSFMTTERAAYSASKGGVVGLTKAMAMQFSNKNIRVNAICPGLIDTPIVSKISTDVKKRPPQFPTVEPVMGRLGKSEEIATMALFLASDESSYATGALFVVDGGMTLR